MLEFFWCEINRRDPVLPLHPKEVREIQLEQFGGFSLGNIALAQSMTRTSRTRVGTSSSIQPKPATTSSGSDQKY